MCIILTQGRDNNKHIIIRWMLLNRNAVFNGLSTFYEKVYKNMGAGNDRRVKYTRMMLRESLVDLLYERDISKVTVKQICERADINRATFYAHYANPYDLFEKIGNELFDNLHSYLQEFPETALGALPVSTVEKILLYIKENQKLCKHLLSERGDVNFQKRIMNLVSQSSVSHSLMKELFLKPEKEYIPAFIVNGCIGAIQEWMEDDFKKSPRDMAELLLQAIEALAGL